MKLTVEGVARTFDFLRRRKHNFQIVFRSPAGQEVLKDLARFCRAHETTMHSDPHIQAGLEGRREVWLRIQQHLNLSSAELASLFSGGAIEVITGDEDGNT